mgnify:CR=1 FL=1
MAHRIISNTILICFIIIPTGLYFYLLYNSADYIKELKYFMPWKETSINIIFIRDFLYYLVGIFFMINLYLRKNNSIKKCINFIIYSIPIDILFMFWDISVILINPDRRLLANQVIKIMWILFFLKRIDIENNKFVFKKKLSSSNAQQP